MQLALTEPQEEFIFCDDAYPALVAGLGAGKSQAGLSRLILRMLQNPKINTAYYMPTYDLLRLRAMPGAEEILAKIGVQFKTNRAEYTIELLGYGRIIFRSYDRPERIVAYEVADSIVDELDTLPKDKAAFVWRKASERNRQQCGRPNTIGNVTTPDQGYSGFTYQRWVKSPSPGYKIIKAATESNPYLPDGYIEQIRANYDPLLADMYLSGEFVSLSRNKVYHFFDRKKHHRQREITDSDNYLHIGLDFNIGGTCASVWLTENNKPYAVDEFVSHDTRDFIAKVQRFKKSGRTLTVYPDASGNSGSTNASKTDIQIIRDAGLAIDCPAANPPIRDSVNAVNALLSHDSLFVNTDKCPNLAAAIESQGYDKQGAPEKLNDHPSMDDWTDGMRYFINRRFPIQRPMTRATLSGI